jgi:hypothetical protein
MFMNILKLNDIKYRFSSIYNIVIFHYFQPLENNVLKINNDVIILKSKQNFLNFILNLKLLIILINDNF